MTQEEREHSQNESSTGNSLYDEFIVLHRSSLHTELKVLAGFIALLVLFRFQAFSHFSSMYIGGWERDSGLYSWLIKSNIRDLFSEPWFNTKAFYPYTRTLAWSDNFILPSLVLAPLISIGVPLTTSYNLLLVLAFILNGYFTYRIAFVLTGHSTASFISGAVFMLSSYLSSQLGHPQLQFAFWIPILLLCYLRFMRAPRFSQAILLGLAVVGAFLTTVYYALFGIMLVTCFAAAVAFLKPWRYRLKHWAILAAGSAVGVSPLLFFLLPYLDVREVFGERGIYESYYFSATGLSYLSASTFNLVYSFSHKWTHAEAHLFPGVVVLLLAISSLRRLTEAKPLRTSAVITCGLFIGAAVLSVPSQDHPVLGYLAALCSWGAMLSSIWWMRVLSKLEYKLGVYILTNRDLIAAFLFCALVFFLLSLGPLGNPDKNQFAPGVFRLFYELMPGFNSIRAISRIGVVSLLCICITIAFGLQSLGRKQLPKGVFATLFTLMLLENFHSTYPLQPEEKTPTVFKNLASEADKGALVVLPMVDALKENETVESWGAFAEYNVKYMHWAHETGRHYLNGYSGQRTKIMKEYPRKLSGFPDSRSLSALRLIPNLKYVVYVSKMDPQFDQKVFLEKLSEHSSVLSLLSEDIDGNYLLSFDPSALISTRSFIRVPSYPSQTLHLDFRVPFGDPGEMQVEILEEDHFGGALLASLELTPGEGTQSKAIRLPEPLQRARPYKLTFSLPSDTVVYLDKVWLTP